VSLVETVFNIHMLILIWIKTAY